MSNDNDQDDEGVTPWQEELREAFRQAGWDDDTPLPPANVIFPRKVLQGVVGDVLDRVMPTIIRMARENYENAFANELQDHLNQLRRFAAALDEQVKSMSGNLGELLDVVLAMNRKIVDLQIRVADLETKGLEKTP